MRRASKTNQEAARREERERRPSETPPVKGCLDRPAPASHCLALAGRRPTTAFPLRYDGRQSSVEGDARAVPRTFSPTGRSAGRTRPTTAPVPFVNGQGVATSGGRLTQTAENGTLFRRPGPGWVVSRAKVNKSPTNSASPTSRISSLTSLCRDGRSWKEGGPATTLVARVKTKIKAFDCSTLAGTFFCAIEKQNETGEALLLFRTFYSF